MLLWSALSAWFPLSIHAVVFYRNEQETNGQWLRERRRASSEGCCATGFCSRFCVVHVVVTAFGGVWQQLLLPSHGQELPFSWLKCFGGAQLLLEHCSLNTAGDEAMDHCEAQGFWFRSGNSAVWLSWTTNWQSCCWSICSELFRTWNFPAASQKPALIIAKTGCK